MSGGVGPCGDIRLPKEETEQKLENEPKTHISKSSQTAVTTTAPRRRGFFTFRQLNALAVIIVLSASGMVSPEDFAFVLFSIAYMYFMSKVAFPTLSPSSDPPASGLKNRLLDLYVFAGAVIGIFLPIAYIFQGIFEGDKQGIKAAAPHVFLLASQVFMEGLTFSGGFSTPIRAFVPIYYNSLRIFTIMEWMRAEISKAEEVDGGSRRRLYVGRGLAMANMGFWGFNLFGFLLPVCLPKAFKEYYSGYNNKVKDSE